MILQRYTFGSKSQLFGSCLILLWCCLWYCKDIHLEANHNKWLWNNRIQEVAYDIAKIYIWKQITTVQAMNLPTGRLLMILQRYTFGSKSQPLEFNVFINYSCLWYCKDIHLEANHNTSCYVDFVTLLLMILQRYTFGSKSQLVATFHNM